MKKIIGIYLLLQAVMKGVCLFLSLRSDESFLPVIVLITCVVLIAGALYVAAMTFTEKARLRHDFPVLCSGNRFNRVQHCVYVLPAGGNASD